jgi:hypothetical protein
MNNTSYRGISHSRRVWEVNEIYKKHAYSGLSNREIWRRYIHPRFGISERTYYQYLKVIPEAIISSYSFLTPDPSMTCVS